MLSGDANVRQVWVPVKNKSQSAGVLTSGCS